MNVKKIAYSILELATVSKGNSIGEVFANTVALAQKAEAAGFKRMWFAEHHNMPAIASSPFVPQSYRPRLRKGPWHRPRNDTRHKTGIY